MSEKPTLPLVPRVEYRPYDIDHELHQQLHVAIYDDDVTQIAELQLALAHGAMVRRDAQLGSLVAAVQRGDGDGVLDHAGLYAYWQGALERDVEQARKDVARARERQAQREADR